MRPRLSRQTALAAFLTAATLASRLFPAPPLVDAATGRAFPGRLEFPLSHLLLTPFASLADVITCNSARQDYALIVLVLLGFGAFRYFLLGQGPRRWFQAHDIAVAFALYLPLTAGFLAWAVLWPHAPPRLVADDPDLMAADFHSHTNLSWDGRRSFTPARNRAWHDDAGFGADFISDHNVFQAGTSNAEEVSLHEAHVVVLGNRSFIDRSNYTDDEAGLERFLSESRSGAGGFAVLSLPEYWRHHWGPGLERLAGAGASGVEIWTSSPKALDFPETKRRQVVDLCRRHGLFMAGATDNHGYGACACVWNILKIPGWNGLDRPRRESAVLEALRGGFGAVSPIVRAKVEPAEGDWIALDAPRALWLMARTWDREQCVFALVWFWLLPFLSRAAREMVK